MKGGERKSDSEDRRRDLTLKLMPEAGVNIIGFVIIGHCRQGAIV